MPKDHLGGLSISGPSPNDRVVVIGGGPGGLHMAHLLKQKGYSRVSVLESETRVGGKVRTQFADGYPHELGACYFNFTYPRLFALLEDLDRQDVVDVPLSIHHVATGDENLTAPVYQWMLQQFASKLSRLGVALPDMAKRVASMIGEYQLLLESIFGDTKPILPQSANPDKRDDAGRSFSELIETERLDPLEIPFLFYNSTNGYGLADNAPLYYSGYWFSSRIARTASTIAAAGIIPSDGSDNNGPSPARNGLLSMFSRGFESIFGDLAKRFIGDDLRLGTRVTKVSRPDAVSGSRASTVHYIQNGTEGTLECDFVIFAIPGKQAVQLLAKPSNTEVRLFEAQIESKLVTTLVETRSPFSEHGVVFWLDALSSAARDRVYAIRDSPAIFDTAGDHTDRHALLTYQYYQHSDDYDEADSLAGIDGFLQENGFSDARILERFAWDYFPRFTPACIKQGKPWQLLENQGALRTWYVGSSVCFESIEAVLELNHFMLDHAVA